jgi:UDP-N-acetylmuramoyl-L-alanyl-D-glutamate--2,6-diaminopimelate ligase
MEVSSHALKQHRSAGTAFDAMVFSNLSSEHLDFHADLEDYFQSKATLFREYVDVAVAAGKHPVLAINVDDAYGKRLYEELCAAGRSRSKLSKSCLRSSGGSMAPISWQPLP